MSKPIFQQGKIAFIAAAFAVIFLNWLTNDITPQPFVMEVSRWRLQPFLESHFLYAGLLAATLIFPLIFSFERRIGYSKNFRFLFPAIGLVAAVFILWDIYFTRIGVWGFNPRYVSGLRIANLPLEECLFFVVIPFSSLFIYESLGWFFAGKRLVGELSVRLVSLVLMGLFFGCAVIFWPRQYSATAFLAAGFVLLFAFFFEKNARWMGRFFVAYAISWLPFMLVNGALTGGFTLEPVVIYNPSEYLGVRIGSVPLDDSVYSFAMLLWNVLLFEGFKKG